MIFVFLSFAAVHSPLTFTELTATWRSADHTAVMEVHIRHHLHLHTNHIMYLLATCTMVKSCPSLRHHRQQPLGARLAQTRSETIGVIIQGVGRSTRRALISRPTNVHTQVSFSTIVMWSVKTDLYNNA